MKKIGRQVLFIGTSENNPRNGEGAFIQLSGGGIMYAFTEYVGDSWSDDASANISAVVSYDCGETWTDRRVLLYTTRDLSGTWGRSPYICAVSKNGGKTFEQTYYLEDDFNNGYCYPAIFSGEDYFLVGYYHSAGSGVCLNSTRITKVYYSELS